MTKMRYHIDRNSQEMRNLSHPIPDQITLPQIFHALSDPARLRIVQDLACGRELACGSLCPSMSKSNASHHFKVLRDAGLIRQRPEGTALQTSLRRDELEARFPGLLGVVTSAAVREETQNRPVG